MSFFKRSVKQVPVEGKTVLIRVDYNVPLAQDGTIHDDFRLQASLPTLTYLLEQGCKVVIISHLGRPKGYEAQYSLEPLAARLGQLLGRSVTFVDDCIGHKVVQAVKKAPKGAVLLLENLRFHSGEEANSTEFAEALVKSTSARYFVQDGFGVAYRAHASTDAITRFVPSVAGLLLEKEYLALTSAMEHPKRPLVAVVGGAKVSDKIGAIERLVAKADTIIVGGAMANTFLQYKGHAMGASIVEPGQEAVLDEIYLAAHGRLKTKSVEDFIVLPSDVAVATAIDATQTRRNCKLGRLSAEDIALDIGDASIKQMVKEITQAGTVLWNGTLGYAELPEFAHGSARLALTLASHPEITSVVGGGDTADFVLNWEGRGVASEDRGVAREGQARSSFTHISTGGGASLALIAGERLPGIDSLLDGPR